VEDIPALKARINDLEFALAASGDREATLERQLADRFSELAVLTSALLQEEEKSEDWQRRANNLLGILRAILSEAPWWWSLMPRRWRRNRLNLRLARLELFDARDYAAKQRDVVAAGHEPLQHYIFHGIDEMRAGTR
jgi:hypothetical protein